MPRFTEFTLADATVALSGLADETADKAEQYLAGDHWQNGDGWIGPRPDSGYDGVADVLDEIERGFVSQNVVAEIVGRHADAVVGQEPDWSFVPARVLKDEEQASAAEATALAEAHTALLAWWERKEVWQRLQEAVANLLTSRRACLRLFIPPDLLNDDGSFKTKPQSLSDVLDVLYLHVAPRAQTAVYVDDDSQEKIGVYGYKRDDQQFYELHGLDAERRTMVKVLSGESADESEPLDLGGHLELFELRRPRFISEQIMSLQNTANMAWSMLGRNVVQGGFLERVILNAQMPGQFVADPANPGKKIFEPNPFYVGAGTTNVLAGLPIYDPADAHRPVADRRVSGYTSPNVIYRDPVNVETFVRTRQEAYAGILGEASQRHALISGDAAASGESRKQATAAFQTSLGKTKLQIEMALRWLLETALWLAAGFTQQPKYRTLLRAQAQCRVDLGPLSAADAQVVIAERTAGLLSLETALLRIGVDDPDAEKAKLAAARKEELQLQIEQQAALVKIGQPAPSA